MKNVLTTIAVVVATAVPVTAQEGSPEGLCPLFGDIAQVVMELRQDGMIISDVMAVIPEDTKTFGSLIVIEAYKVPHYSTQEYKDRAVVDFRNVMELLCYTSMG